MLLTKKMSDNNYNSLFLWYPSLKDLREILLNDKPPTPVRSPGAFRNQSLNVESFE